MLKLSDSVTHRVQVGRTPLVRLQRLPGKTSNVILAKLEGDNPAGSVKDRCAAPFKGCCNASHEHDGGSNCVNSPRVL